MNIAIVTGASSGLGKEFARQLDAMLHRTDEIWLIARRKKCLQELSVELRNKTRIFAYDLTNERKLADFRKTLEQERPVIRILVNSAGYGLLGDFTSLERKEQLGMIDLNCKALTALTYDCLPYMRKNSRIIQIASSAAFTPEPGFAVYAATKAYVLSFASALREELRERKIYVTAVCPGPVDTEFFDIAERYEKGLAIKKSIMVQPERVVREALRASIAKKPVSVCTVLMKTFHIFGGLLPETLTLRLMRIFV